MSKKNKIEGTYDTPSVYFEPNEGFLNISGRSLPANTFEFYSPIIKTVTDYLEKPDCPSTTVEFKMDFISSSSTKVFQELFFHLHEAHQKGIEIKINWYYKLGDDDMKELGDELRLDSDMELEFIVYE